MKQLQSITYTDVVFEDAENNLQVLKPALKWMAPQVKVPVEVPAAKVAVKAVTRRAAVAASVPVPAKVVAPAVKVVAPAVPAAVKVVAPAAKAVPVKRIPTPAVVATVPGPAAKIDADGVLQIDLSNWQDIKSIQLNLI